MTPCNGHTLTNSAHHIQVVAPRIRTNGSLPRPSKPRPALALPRDGSALLETLSSKSNDDVITASSADDVYRPHTIPRRGAKMALVEID